MNEFCVAGNHDPDHDTAQELIHVKSCWETIASNRKYAAAAPASLPIDLPPPPQAVNIDTNCCAGLRRPQAALQTTLPLVNALARFRALTTGYPFVRIACHHPLLLLRRVESGVVAFVPY